MATKAKFSKQKISKMFKNIARHHIDSFDYAMTTCLERACGYMLPFDYLAPDEAVTCGFKKMTLWYDSIELGTPTSDDLDYQGGNLYPSECRQRRMTYSMPLFAVVSRKFDDEMVDHIRVKLGDIPVMVGSKFCNLRGLDERELVTKGEDMSEFGGYFVVNGNEKVVRMLIVPKRNFPIAFMRPTFVNRGADFTAYAVQMRCVRDDLAAQTITLHYLSDGSISLRLLYQKQEFLIPVILILKALKNCTDKQIYERVVKGHFNQRQISDRVEAILAAGKDLNIYDSDQSKALIGSRFRVVLAGVTNDMSDIDAGDLFLANYICIHVSSYEAKFDALLLMIDKLYAAVADETELDNLDSVAMQDVLLGGHLYLQLLTEKLFDCLHINLRARVTKELKRANFDPLKFRDILTTKRLIEASGLIGKRMENFLATGNLVSRTNLDLMQTTGFSIIGDKLNSIRYLSHFRSIHRGQYFAEQKTTSVRKLLPESWGFLCPVHTPDGAPCGLLNHISMSCVPLGSEEAVLDVDQFRALCAELGMHSAASDLCLNYSASFYPVVLDGVHLGYVDKEVAASFVESLRFLKCTQSRPDCYVPRTLEIAFIAFSGHERNLQWPGIFMASTPARFTRPVKNLHYNCIEWISPLEQMNLSIACTDDDISPETTHQELDPTNILSIVASVGVFSEYNQSPRNMYQCQMAKQTMGTPYHNHQFRADNKVYRLLFPQRPIVKTRTQVDFDIEEYPSGTNAVVAVISYTGYDLEDAMIINKSSYERGFKHGAVYKSYIHDLNETASQNVRGIKSSVRYKLLNNVNKKDKARIKLDGIDSDGFPKVGTQLTKGKPELCVFDTLKRGAKLSKFKDSEKARIETIRVSGNDDKNPDNVSVGYTIRYSRNPVIGDKFSSRHGQKGVLSVLWPQVDMPFTESGITPDLIINPHAFPSRMTMGMLIESMAAKSGSLRGEFKTVETFQKYKNDDIVDHFGKELLKNGYNYYGNELMYSGIYGTPLKVDIFLGVVYYQRLRHMVSDKSQARATGPIDILTHQPVKGRKKGGGIRFGEMERDSMLAHGAAYCLNDRLFRSSDYSEGFVCQNCGSILSCYVNRAIMKTQSFVPTADDEDKDESTDKEIHMNEKVI